MQLVALNVMVFAVVNLAALFGVDVSQWVSVPSSPALFIVRPWTVLTYMVVHFSFFHLLFNMLWLYWFGEYFLTLGTDRQLAVLNLYGGLLGAAFYLAAGACGWIGFGELCGASASVLAIVVATAWRMPRFEMQLFLLGGVQLRWIALATVVLSVLALPGSNVGGNVAHLGGALAGALFALLVKAGIDVTDLRPRRRKARGRAAVISDTDDRAVLDSLLDKVRRSGYGSLNSSERKKLLELSNKL